MTVHNIDRRKWFVVGSWRWVTIDGWWCWNRFNQGGGAEKKAKGLGLGLAIVKKILEVHGVDITTTSAPNKGTTFSFDIPIYLEKFEPALV